MNLKYNLIEEKRRVLFLLAEAAHFTKYIACRPIEKFAEVNRDVTLRHRAKMSIQPSNQTTNCICTRYALDSQLQLNRGGINLVTNCVLN